MSYLEIGPVPGNEECAQVGEDDYYERGPKECRAFKHQLERQFPSLPGDMRFGVKAFGHELGTYHEVVIYFRHGLVEQAEMASRVEREAAGDWDEEARRELDSAESTKEVA